MRLWLACALSISPSAALADLDPSTADDKPEVFSTMLDWQVCQLASGEAAAGLPEADAKRLLFELEQVIPRERRIAAKCFQALPLLAATSSSALDAAKRLVDKGVPRHDNTLRDWSWGAGAAGALFLGVVVGALVERSGSPSE